MTFVKYMGGSPKHELTNEIIANSTTLTIGDVVTFSSGFLALVGAGNKMLGVVEGFVTKDGVALDNALASQYDGTYTSGGLGVGTYVSSSDNQTDKQVKAVIRVFVPGMVLSSPLDGTIGATTGSDLKGYYTDVPASSDQLDENVTGTGVAQFYLLGQDPNKLGNNVWCVPAELAYVF